MKKALFLISWLLAGALPAWAVDDAPERRPLRESMYSVSSDEIDKTESLNRISGKIDLGFSAPSDSYQSSSHYSPGPFAREQAAADIS